MAEQPIAEKWPDHQRLVGSDPRDEQVTEPDVEHADGDVLIEGKDLGPDATTFVADGDPIPPDLAGLPRRGARGAPRKR